MPNHSRSEYVLKRDGKENAVKRVSAWDLGVTDIAYTVSPTQSANPVTRGPARFRLFADCTMWETTPEGLALELIRRLIQAFMSPI